MKIINQIGYWALIVFFSYTFMNKLLLLDSFLLNIAKTGLFSQNQVYAVAIIGLILECLAIVIMVFKKRAGLIFTFVMMLLFSIYIFILQALGRYEVCGCGGFMNGLDFNVHFLINISIICLIFFLIQTDKCYEKYY